MMEIGNLYVESLRKENLLEIIKIISNTIKVKLKIYSLFSLGIYIVYFLLFH